MEEQLLRPDRKPSSQNPVFVQASPSLLHLSGFCCHGIVLVNSLKAAFVCLLPPQIRTPDCCNATCYDSLNLKEGSLTYRTFVGLNCLRCLQLGNPKTFGSFGILFEEKCCAASLAFPSASQKRSSGHILNRAVSVHIHTGLGLVIVG